MIRYTWQLFIIKSDFSNGLPHFQYLQSIGYCPQDDALNYSLTGKAILTAVAKLRGVGETEVAKILNLFGK